MKATEVTAGLAESNGSLLLGLWCDSLHVTCGLTACTLESAPGPTLSNEYGKTLPFLSRYQLTQLAYALSSGIYCVEWGVKLYSNQPVALLLLLLLAVSYTHLTLPTTPYV